MDVLALGELNPDLLVRGLPRVPAFGDVEEVVRSVTPLIGGSSAIFACGAARLGLDTAIVGVVGDDMFGRFMLDAMTERGVDCSQCVVDPAVPTGATVILERADEPGRALLTSLGAISALTGRNVSTEVLASTRHVHVGSYYLQHGLRPDLREIFARAHASGATTSLDPNADPTRSWDALVSLLPEVDVLFANAAEARALTGCADLLDAGRSLASGGPRTVVVKDGAAGATAVRGDVMIHVQPPLIDVVDATGAGDSLAAGVIYGMLAGWPLERTLRLGVACGSLSTTALGGTAAQPDLELATATASTLPVANGSRTW